MKKLERVPWWVLCFDEQQVALMTSRPTPWNVSHLAARRHRSSSLLSDKQLLVLAGVAASQLEAGEDLLSRWGQVVLGRKRPCWRAVTLPDVLPHVGQSHAPFLLLVLDLSSEVAGWPGRCCSCSRRARGVQSQHVLHHLAGARWDASRGIGEHASLLTLHRGALWKSLSPRLWRGAPAAVCAPCICPGRRCGRLSDRTACAGKPSRWVVMPVVLHRLSGKAIIMWLVPGIEVGFPRRRLGVRFAWCSSHSQDWVRQGMRNRLLITKKLNRRKASRSQFHFFKPIECCNCLR